MSWTTGVSASIARPRWRLVGVALGSAIATAGVVAALTGTTAAAIGGVLYVVLAAVAVVLPAAILGQVLYGQLMLVALLVGPAQVDLLEAVSLMAGVIVTAELLAEAAWLDTALPRESPQALPIAAHSALLGAAVFGLVLLSGAVPGPGGVVSVGLAAGSCAVVAMVVLRGAERGER